MTKLHKDVTSNFEATILLSYEPKYTSISWSFLKLRSIHKIGLTVSGVQFGIRHIGRKAEILEGLLIHLFGILGYGRVNAWFFSLFELAKKNGTKYCHPIISLECHWVYRQFCGKRIVIWVE